MKNQFMLKSLKFALAFVFILFVSSCSDDNDALDAAALAKDQINGEISAKGAKVSTQSTFKITSNSVICSSVCINERVLFNDDTSNEIGRSGKFKIVDYQIWNTATQLIVQTTSNVPTDKVLIVVNGITYTNNPTADIPGGSPLYTYFDLPEGYNACEYILESVRVDGGGPQAELSGINYGAYIYCPIGCTIIGEEFSGAAVSCNAGNRVAEYTFSSEDGVGYFKMQGGLTNFTGANAIVYVNNELVVFSGTSSDGWAEGIALGYTVAQRTPGKSSNRNIRVEGSLDECATIVIRIEWTTDNQEDTMTGEWSVKDINGNNLADDIADLLCPIN